MDQNRITTVTVTSTKKCIVPITGLKIDSVWNEHYGPMNTAFVQTAAYGTRVYSLSQPIPLFLHC